MMSGDVIGVFVDVVAHTVEFSHNGKRLGAGRLRSALLVAYVCVCLSHEYVSCMLN